MGKENGIIYHFIANIRLGLCGAGEAVAWAAGSSYRLRAGSVWADGGGGWAAWEKLQVVRVSVTEGQVPGREAAGNVVDAAGGGYATVGEAVGGSGGVAGA